MDTNLNQNNKRVSIVMITKNRAGFIREAIASVFDQTYTNWNLIIIDDGSTDDTAKIIDSFQNHPKYSAIKYIKNEKSIGISRARNQAIPHADGEYLAVLDSDDIWNDKNKLSLQVEFLSKNPNIAVVGTFVQKIDAAGQKIGDLKFPTDDSSIRKEILSRNPFCHSSVLLSIEEIKNVGGYDESLFIWEDYDLFLRLGKNSKFANLDKAMTSYRVHSGGISKSAGISGALLHLRIINKYRKDYPHYPAALVKGLFRIILRAIS